MIMNTSIDKGRIYQGHSNLTPKTSGCNDYYPRSFGDNRRCFMETYKKELFAEVGITKKFVQDNESSSTKGVLRGLYF